MCNGKYQGLAKALFCLCMLLNVDVANAEFDNLEGQNLIGPKRPSLPKQDWVDHKPQGQVYSGPVDYFKKHPELLGKAVKYMTQSNRGLIIKRDHDGNPDFSDSRY